MRDAAPILVYLQILQLFKDGVMREDEDQVVFERDHFIQNAQHVT